MTLLRKIVCLGFILCASMVYADNSSSGFGGGGLGGSSSGSSTFGGGASSFGYQSSTGGGSAPAQSSTNNAFQPSSLPGQEISMKSLASGPLANKATNNKKASTFQDNIPDEFQTNVQLRTGLSLQRYGYDAFTDTSRFDAAENKPATSNYVLGPGDQISIRTWGAFDFQYQTTVDPSGDIVLPKIGRISLAGVKASDLDTYLKSKIGKMYRNFSISTAITKIRSIQITVAGFAKLPGTYTISSLSTLTDAIFASGGPSPQGSLRHIQLRRNGGTIVDYDMYDLLLNGKNISDIRLSQGDIVYIMPYGRQAAIYDGVKIPAIYEARENETISDVVRFAGGYTYNNPKQQVIVETMDENKAIQVSNYAFATGLKQLISNGEIIHFFTAPNIYKKSVVLIGNVANPSRFSWHPGLKINDIISNKEALLTKSFWNSYSLNSYGKDTLISQLGIEKTSNGAQDDVSSSQFSSGLNSKESGSAKRNVFGGGDNLFTAGPISIPEANINWHYAVVVRINPKTFDTELYPFDLELAINGDSKNNLVLQDGDIINVLSSKDMAGPSKLGKIYVFIDGEVNRPGVYELNPGAKLLDAISRAGDLTPDAYVYALELDRQVVKKRQKAALNRLLDQAQQDLLAQATAATAASAAGGPNPQQIMSQQQAYIDQLRQLQPTGRIVFNLNDNKITLKDMPNLILENGDAIHVPPSPSTVEVVGQVYNPATFMYNKSLSVDDYINEAGTTNQFADNSSIYVLHADGTLYSKQEAGWFGTFGSRSVYAGDVIVVPQNVQFMTFQQNLINWTQVLANFGLGMAAISQFKSN